MKLNTLEDTFNLSKKIGKLLSHGDVIFLYGEIGVGKTTFVRGLINNLEVEKGMDKSQILSPTFNIVFEYDIKKLTIKHYDLYRLRNDSDIKNIGFFEDLEQTITLIEWPELIKKKPSNRIDLFFEYSDSKIERSLIIKTSGRLKIHEFK